MFPHFAGSETNERVWFFGLGPPKNWISLEQKPAKSGLRPNTPNRSDPKKGFLKMDAERIHKKHTTHFEAPLCEASTQTGNHGGRNDDNFSESSKKFGCLKQLLQSHNL